MLLFRIPSLHKPPLSSLPPLSLLLNNRRSFIPKIVLDGGGDAPCKKSSMTHSTASSSSRSIRAVQKDSQQFEVDPDKAREALKKLDQQLQSLSQKQVTPPRKKASDMNLESPQLREEMPEISESFLAYSAFALLAFSIFYNVLFYAVIQSSIDGPESVPEITMGEVPTSAGPQQLSSIPEFPTQQ